MPPDVPPVIDKLYDLILWLLPHIAKFPRSQRFVLGDRIERSVLDVQELLIEAAYSRRKTDLLKQANIRPGMPTSFAPHTMPLTLLTQG